MRDQRLLPVGHANSLGSGGGAWGRTGSEAVSRASANHCAGVASPTCKPFGDISTHISQQLHFCPNRE